MEPLASGSPPPSRNWTESESCSSRYSGYQAALAGTWDPEVEDF